MNRKRLLGIAFVIVSAPLTMLGWYGWYISDFPMVSGGRTQEEIEHDAQLAYERGQKWAYIGTGAALVSVAGGFLIFSRSRLENIEN